MSTINIEQGLDHLLFSISNSLRCEKKQGNTVVFRYGDKGNKCYLLLIGSVSILLPKENQVKCSFLVYFKHLMLLNLINEKELLRNTI